MARSNADDVRKYALLGAQARLTALREELQFILDRFPELAGQASVRSSRPGRAPKRKWEMSPEARKAVSERMRKYWAARRRAKAAATKVAKA